MTDFPEPPVEVLYEERLWPSPLVWMIVSGVAGASILVFTPISVEAGIVACAVIFLLLATVLVLSTPRITLTRTALSVGRAHIERGYLGQARAYVKDEATFQRGQGLNALAYLCIRGWIDPVVRVEVEDEEDRTPYWLVSTRRPEELRDALNRGIRLSGRSESQGIETADSTDSTVHGQEPSHPRLA